ncbi:MAG: hypothetical protein J6P14_04265 [Ruminococcus sp.]|jgi:hypothetical protein|nr:hypothetical protein [Ruminococcus sp.]
MGFLISLVIGLVVAGIIVGSMISKLKNVHMQKGAAAYTVHNSMHLTVNRDVFLSKKVEKTPRNTQTQQKR